MSIYSDTIENLFSKNVELALQQLQYDSSNGSLEAKYLLGKTYLDATYVTKDTTKSYYYLQEAALSRVPDAMYWLAELLDNNDIDGLSIQEKNEKILYWYQQAISCDYEPAMFKLGYKYDKGESPVEHNIRKALYYYEMSAEREYSPLVYISLSRLYMLPGHTADYAKARIFMDCIYNNTTIPFQLSIVDLFYGRMYKDGLGVPKDLNKAYAYFKSSATRGNSEAKKELQHFKKGFLGWKLI